MISSLFVSQAYVHVQLSDIWSVIRFSDRSVAAPAACSRCMLPAQTCNLGAPCIGICIWPLPRLWTSMIVLEMIDTVPFLGGHVQLRRIHEIGCGC